MPPGEITSLPDSALILRVYEKWGEDAPKHLIGDYTFALWDARRQLLLVRSLLGNRPLYYIHMPRGFAFDFGGSDGSAPVSPARALYSLV